MNKVLFYYLVKPTKFRYWLLAWVQLAESMAMILTFGQFYIYWVFNILCWMDKKYIQLRG